MEKGSPSEIEEKVIKYLNCPKCLAELPEDQTPRDFAKLNVAAVSDGILVICTRHDIDLLLIPADIVELGVINSECPGCQSCPPHRFR